MTSPLAQVKWSAVLIGSAVDISGSAIAAAFIGVVAATVLRAPGQSVDQLQSRLIASTGFLVTELVIGLAFSAAGAWVAARIARRRELLHAALTAVVCAALGILFMGLVHSNPVPLWYRIAGYVLVLPVAVLGGVLARAQNLRVAHPAP